MANYKNLRTGPPDHAVGRSRGGLSTKIHQLVDGHDLPLVVLVGVGQSGDAPMFPVPLHHLRIARSGPGRPRTRPETVRGDKAYSSRAIRGPAAIARGSAPASPNRLTRKATDSAVDPRAAGP